MFVEYLIDVYLISDVSMADMWASLVILVKAAWTVGSSISEASSFSRSCPLLVPPVRVRVET